MLPILEKVVWGLTAFVVLLFGAAYYFVGLPSTTPLIAMGSKEISTADLEKRLKPEQEQRLRAEKTGINFNEEGEAVPRPEGKRPAKEIVLQVNDELLDRFGSMNDCMNELMNAKSEVLEDGGLKVFDIAKGSLIEKVGLQDNDIIDRVGGLQIDFQSASQCKDTWKQCLEKLETGSPFVVELRRNGALHHVVVTPGLDVPR